MDGVVPLNFTDLPEEVQVCIFSHLDLDTLSKCRGISRDWYRLCSSLEVLTANFRSVPENLKPLNSRLFMYALTLIDAQEPTDVSGYGEDRRAIQRWRWSLEKMRSWGCGLAVTFGVGAGIALFFVAYCDHRLWERIPKRLPNGEIEMQWVWRRYGNVSVFQKEPVMLRIPRDLPTVDRVYWEGYYRRSLRNLLILGAIAGLSGYLSHWANNQPLPSPPPLINLDTFNISAWFNRTRGDKTKKAEKIWRQGLCPKRIAHQLRRVARIHQRYQSISQTQHDLDAIRWLENMVCISIWRESASSSTFQDWMGVRLTQQGRGHYGDVKAPSEQQCFEQACQLIHLIMREEVGQETL